MNAFPNALELPRFPPGTTIQSGTSHLSPSRIRKMIGLLPFKPERIDRIHQVDAQPVSDLTHSVHGVIKVADDLNRQCSVVESCTTCRKRFFPIQQK